MPYGTGGAGGGIVYPDSAARPFNSNSARNTWANNNKSDLIKDTTVVNVGGSQWYLWAGESNPDTVNSNLWMDADQIVQGETGDKGDTGPFGQIVSAEFVGNDIVFTDNSGNEASLSNAAQTLKGGVGDEGPVGDSAYDVWLSQGNTGTEQDYLASLKGDKGDTGSAMQLANATYYQSGQDQYVSLDRVIPVYSQSPIADGQLVKIVGEDAVTGLLEVEQAAQGELAIGIADNGGGNLFSVSSGYFSTPTGGAQGDLLYIDSNGQVSLVESDYPVGEITQGGELIDIDLYRSAIFIKSTQAPDLSNYQQLDAQEVDYPSILQDGKQVANAEDAQKLLVDGQLTDELIVGAGINADRDQVTGKVSLTVDPTNIDLSDYAKKTESNTFEGQQIISKATGVSLSLRTTPTGTDQIKFWSSGAIELPNYTNFKTKELITKEYADTEIAKGYGVGVQSEQLVSATTYTQTVQSKQYTHDWGNSSTVTITIDSNLVGSETVIEVPADNGIYSSVSYTISKDGFISSKRVFKGEVWSCRTDSTGDSVNFVWSKLSGGESIVQGLGGRLDPTQEPGVRLFQYADGMPYHLLVETPTSSRLVHEFPKNKTFRFTPINSAREHDGNVSISQANQGVAVGDLALGQYSDIPLYIIEPNVIVNRDQRAYINFPASITIDASAGFYAFGTVSGWCGNNNTEGNVGVYVGTSENFRSYTNSIGLVLGNSGLFLLDGFNLRTPNNNTLFAFNFEPGVTHMYRYAFYVDADGLMTYYVVNLNTGQVSSGTQQCNLSALGADPKLYVSYDRYGNNTAAIAIAETHLVVNSTGDAEDRWNWRN